MTGTLSCVECNLVDIGNAIRTRRSARKLNQRELARLVGLHFSVLNRIEMGHRDPSFKELVRIASALGCRVESLVSFKRAS